jgi:hypothetical protein
MKTTRKVPVFAVFYFKKKKNMNPAAIAGFALQSAKDSSDEAIDRLLDSIADKNATLKTFVRELFKPPAPLFNNNNNNNNNNDNNNENERLQAQLEILKYEKEFGLESHSRDVSWLFKNVVVRNERTQETTQQKVVFRLTQNAKVFIFLLQLIKHHRGGTFCFFDKLGRASTNGSGKYPEWVEKTAKHFFSLVARPVDLDRNADHVEMHTLVRTIFDGVDMENKDGMEENLKKTINNFWNRATNHWAETKENQRKEENLSQNVQAIIGESPTSSNKKNNNNTTKLRQSTLVFNSSPNNLSITTGDRNRDNNNKIKKHQKNCRSQKMKMLKQWLGVST